MKLSTLSASIALALFATPMLAQPQTSAANCAAALEAAQKACADKATPSCLREKLPAECPLPGESSALERITVVGTRFGIDVQKYPGSASVLLPEDLDTATDMIQALKAVPGFDTGNDGGRAIGQSFSIRGFGHGSENRVILMQDGVRRSANLFANQVSGFGMDPVLVKQVDVVRGSSGISYGGGAIGGVVGSTTKDASDFVKPGNSFGGVANYRFDSNNQHQIYGAFAYAPENRPFEFLVFAKQAARGNLRMAGDIVEKGVARRNETRNDEDIDTRFIKAGWNIGAGHKLMLSHYDHRLDVVTGWNSLYHTTAPSPKTGAVIGERVQQDTVLAWRLNPPQNPWLALSANAYVTRGWYERGYELVDLYYKNEDRRWGFNLQNLSQFNTGSVGHRLLLGVDYENREEGALYISEGKETRFGSIPNRYRDLGIFVQHESAWFDERLLLQLGGRYDRFHRQVIRVDADYDNSRFSPRLGLSYELFDGFNLLANYSEAFRAPSPHETSSSGPLNIHYWYLPNPNLKAETSREYEAGFSWRRHGLFTEHDRFNTKLMFFNGRIKDMIRLVVDYGSVSPGKSEYAQYQNVDGVDRRGLEFVMSYDQPHWGTTLSFEKLDMEDVKTGKKSPSAFADRARLGLHWQPFADDFSVSFDISHWFRPEQNPQTLVSRGVTYWYVRQPYTQSNLQMRWRPQNSGVRIWDERLEFLLGINNVFDQKRLPAGGVETTSRTGLGRNVYFSITKQF